MIKSYSANKLKIIEFLLGSGLGLGYLTSLRFIGLIGVSEVLFLLATLVLSTLYLKDVFRFKKNSESYVRLYLIFSFFVIAPCVTAITGGFTEYDNSPIYLAAYSIEIILLFLIVNAMKNGLSMGSVTSWFLFFFLLTNAITIFFPLFFPLLFPAGIEPARYSGGASNPNQLLFYSGSLTLLLIIYLPKTFIFAFPALTYLMLKTGSDAYILSVAIIPVMYILFKVFSFKKASLGVNALSQLFVGILLLFFTGAIFSEEIISIWSAADEGGVRVSLLKNAFLASIQSPLFGWGVGSFSGLDSPFQGWEAHNTFLDLASQFGFILPLILYFLMFAFLIKNYKNANYLVAVFVLSYIVAGLFHFYARHFVFWVELAVFYHSFFYSKYIRLAKQ